jgi:DNA-binding beta-propeller fold protein YncE
MLKNYLMRIQLLSLFIIIKKHRFQVTSALALTVSLLAVVAPLHAEFAYVTNLTDNTVWGYAVDRASGALTVIAGSPFPGGSFPISIAVHPSGKFAYTANVGDNTISGYAIDPGSGALTALTGSPFIGSPPPFELAAPESVAIDPSGRFAYVANTNNANGFGVQGYTIDLITGALTVGSTFVAQGSPHSVTVDPSGKFVYVAMEGGSNVWGYTIDPASGALTEMTSSPFPARPGPYSVTVDPSGTFVYVACTNSSPRGS